MRGALRRAVLWSCGASLLVSVLLVSAFAVSGELSGMSGMSIGMLEPLQRFAWATVLDLGWWASGGALLAAFVIAHRRGGVPGASGDPPAAEAR